MTDEDEVSLKLMTVVLEGRLLRKSVFDFNRQWLEAHTFRELILEHAVADFDSQLDMRADAGIFASCVQHIDVTTASRGRRRQPQDKYDITRRLQKKIWKVMHDMPTDKYSFDVERKLARLLYDMCYPVEIEYYTRKTNNPACLGVHPHLMRRVRMVIK
eukprot:jgi/Tetstr1/431375/TSEL_021066.t1